LQILEQSDTDAGSFVRSESGASVRLIYDRALEEVDIIIVGLAPPKSPLNIDRRKTRLIILLIYLVVIVT
jgi:hypothetical protein